jgi:hypothetical protein
LQQVQTQEAHKSPINILRINLGKVIKKSFIFAVLADQGNFKTEGGNSYRISIRQQNKKFIRNKFQNHFYPVDLFSFYLG